MRNGLIWIDSFSLYSVAKGTSNDEGEVFAGHVRELPESSVREITSAANWSV